VDVGEVEDETGNKKVEEEEEVEGEEEEECEEFPISPVVI